ncbi:hypothetical protein PC116_g18751 [Phytophthora cactorum]|uniref:Uncharacterized protein n=1 Tax=Phytophthora cactorum TaxID=29920 RepID=A0A8T1KFI0_9STRA|nr:hypothetical protein PC117_g16044 [Phytophthora cactorum]KAG2975641.1 hypothetical protein PC118_g13808 [Phytophthora cactorum]KAG3056736.1 hypothetical protein PC121_g15184 [Phytophthora cactorum]KAG3076009.1 hypothetical protein PC122_g13753 [Phytophthora cactorum]KAG4233031.1 hypothetical protein PC116_g18751 [Phytophthora cactorum]
MVVNVVGFAMVSPPSTTELSPMNVSYRKTVKNDTESGSDISTSSSELSRGSSASLQANLMDAQFQLLTAQIPAGGDVEFGRDDEEDLLPAADELVTQEDLAVHIGRGVTRTTFTFWFEVYGVYHCASEL